MMKTEDILLLGLKRSVVAIEKKTGRILWTTKLATGRHEFVTLACDSSLVFAHTGGQLHCLELDTGRLIWSNPLKGFGYGLGTICFPGSATNQGTVVAREHYLAEEAAAAAAAGGAAS